MGATLNIAVGKHAYALTDRKQKLLHREGRDIGAGDRRAAVIGPLRNAAGLDGGMAQPAGRQLGE